MRQVNIKGFVCPTCEDVFKVEGDALIKVMDHGERIDWEIFDGYVVHYVIDPECSDCFGEYIFFVDTRVSLVKTRQSIELSAWYARRNDELRANDLRALAREFTAVDLIPA